MVGRQKGKQLHAVGWPPFHIEHKFIYSHSSRGLMIPGQVVGTRKKIYLECQQAEQVVD
jgi:hypothetical protein